MGVTQIDFELSSACQPFRPGDFGMLIIISAEIGNAVPDFDGSRTVRHCFDVCVNMCVCDVILVTLLLFLFLFFFFSERRSIE